MKILLAHNHYSNKAPSGENRVFELERDLLRVKGHQVRTYEASNDSLRKDRWLGAAKGGITATWNTMTARRIRNENYGFSPDIVHAHNLFPRISPSVFSAFPEAARVLTLHNYRIFCPKAVPLRNGQICFDCIDHQNSIYGIFRSCYRDSAVATIPISASIELNRLLGTWDKLVDVFIVLSEFQKEIMVRGGLPESKVFVKPNFVDIEYPTYELEERSRSIVFVGRISEEKGVVDALEAWRLWGSDAPDLKIVGDGPLREQLEHEYSDLKNVNFMGALPQKETFDQIAQSRMLLLPSRWTETFGMVLIEAFSLGTPVAVANSGPLPSLVGPASGIVFEPGNPSSIVENVKAVIDCRSTLNSMAHLGLELYKSSYTSEINYSSMIRLYRKAIEHRELLR